MTANKVIERVDAIRPNSYNEEQKFGWINKLEEMVQRLVFQFPRVNSLSYPEDMDRELLITVPFDDLYELYLESMIDYYNREYGNYNNSAMMFETRFTEYKKAYIRGEVEKPTISDGSSSGSKDDKKARIANVILRANAWVGLASPYSQVVKVDGVTKNSQVDLTPSVEQLVVFYQKDLAFVTENEDGVVTVYAIGQRPANDYTIQATITEVSV